jgi:alkanesulfonate monooxygenase SsuD/methylene tetrahydromethanopterin reductase-like flavin-dependent oxidoreductase (luciferase family)
MGPTSGEGWPVPAADFSPELAQASYETTLNQAEIADQLGWDWVSVAEHHFAPFSISPNPMVMAAAFSQRVKTAKIALMGPDTPILNPVRVAKGFAMLDNLTGGRIVAGLRRGAPNEYVTYNVHPNESRGRFEESLKLIKMVLTEKQPSAGKDRIFSSVRSLSGLAPFRNLTPLFLCQAPAWRPENLPPTIIRWVSVLQ